jgi:hypothetical protein
MCVARGAGLKALPSDLAESVRALRRDAEPPDFRGIPGRDVHGWLRRVGRRQGQGAGGQSTFSRNPGTGSVGGVAGGGKSSKVRNVDTGERGFVGRTSRSTW